MNTKKIVPKLFFLFLIYIAGGILYLIATTSTSGRYEEVPYYEEYQSYR